MEDLIYELIALVIAFCIYFLPSILAVNNKKKNKNAIILVNLVTGWTIIFWFICLVWSILKD